MVLIIAVKGLRIREILESSPVNDEITVQGWIRTRRDSKNLCFLEINDGSSLRNLQGVIDLENLDLTGILEKLTTGASVEIRGKVQESPGAKQRMEIQVQAVQVIGDAPVETYPLQKKRHSFEFLREIAHLRPRTNTLGAVARIRNAMSFAIHTYFQERGFFYIHTPIIAASDAEGAGEMFQVTTLPSGGSDSKGGGLDYDQDFFGKKTYLTVSGQLEAEVYALAMGNVYTFGPTFRAENSNTSRHLAEFWMIEPEMAFCDIECNMDLAEEFLKYLLNRLLEDNSEDMEFFNTWIQKGVVENLSQVAGADFARISYDEAIRELQKAKVDFEFPTEWGADLQSEHERYLTETVYGGPVIVTDYPKEIKAFYMKLNEDGRTVRAMDVLVPRLGEIIGGSERESDFSILQSRIREQSLPEEQYWWYLDLRRYGSVPHSGFGLGFERFIQYVTGMQNIRDVIPFPRTVNTAEF